jgi:hypothetical protein
LRPLDRYNVIQFATHGLVRGELSGLDEAALVLTPGPDVSDGANDGLLYASEISNLDLNAKLVVLSACNTANFDTALFGSGLQGLAISFALAGAPTMLASLWPVESNISQELMTNFFKHAVEEQNYVARAFRLALQDTLGNLSRPAYHHPRFWAPFIVLGDGGVTLKNDSTVDRGSYFENRALENRTGEIIKLVSGRDGDFLVSMIADWDGKRMASVLQRRTPEGEILWETSDHVHGAGPIAAHGDDIYMGTYVSEDEGRISHPFIRKCAYTDGHLVWEKDLTALIPNGMPSQLQIDEGGNLFATFTSSGSDASLIVLKLTSDGTQLSRAEFPGATKNLLSTSSLLAPGGLFVSISRFTFNKETTIRRDRFGLVNCCGSSGETELIVLDPDFLRSKLRTTVSGLSINKLELVDSTVLIAGGEYKNCSLDRRAVVGEFDASLNYASVWRDDTPFETEAVAAFKFPWGYRIIGRSKITTDTAKRSDATAKLDYSSRRMGDENYSRDEIFEAVMFFDGKRLPRRYFSAGLPAYVADAVATPNTNAVGSIGGTPLWLTEHGDQEPEHPAAH